MLPSVTNWYGTIDVDSWPTAISWGANAGTGATDRYRVEFLSVARTWDIFVDSPPTQLGGTPAPTRLLSAVKVESMQASAWETVSQYTLTADSGMFNDEDTTDNNANVLPSYKKITLRSVQRVGSDGTSALPATSFAYGLTRSSPGANFLGDWNRLKSVDNGQGGTVSVAYENLVTTTNDGAFFNIRRVTSVTVTDGRGQSAIWRYAYTNPEVNSLAPPSCTNPPSPLPPYPTSPRSLNSAALYLGYHWGGNTSPNGYNSYELLAAPIGQEFRGHATTTITDPNGVQTIRSFYQGDTRDAGATACTIPSSVQGQNIALYNNDPCFQRLRTNGFLVGREYQTEVRGPTGAGSPLYRRTQRTFTVGSYNYGGTLLTGLWNAWTYPSQETTTIFEGGGTGTSRTTKYTYLDSGGNRDPFGDLLAVEEDDPAGAAYRTTRYQYAWNTDATHYFVRRTQETRADGAGAQIARSDRLYDGQPFGSVGALGDLTTERAYYDLAGSHSGNIGHGYDAYGNPTTVTTFTGADGTGTAATTTTAYDPTFHTFPTQVTSPTVGGVTLTEQAGYDYRMGTMTSVTDPNGTATSATYDLFGRLATLVRPGDSAASPTVQVAYYDYNAGTNQPAHFITTQRMPWSCPAQVDTR